MADERCERQIHIKEKCLIHNEFNFDQIIALEKITEHVKLLGPYLYGRTELSIFSKEKQDVILASNDNRLPEVIVRDNEWSEEDKKTIPIYLGINNKVGIVAVEAKKTLSENYFEDLKLLYTGRSNAYSPTNDLLPDGFLIINLQAEIECTNYTADSILFRLGFQDLSFSELGRALGFSREDIAKYITQPAFLALNLSIQQFDIILIVNPLFAGDKFVGALVVLSDISSVKRIEKELMEKHTVIKEIHHRVKNNLQTIISLLRLQMRRTNSKVVEKILNRSINRILSIALIHEALSKQNFEVVNIKQTSYNILQTILSNMVDPSQNITGEISGTEVFLPATVASNVSLCITELIQNAVEHAFIARSEGSIRVAVGREQDEVFITVEDNGIGISAKAQNGGQLGTQIVDSIIQRKLKGRFSLESYRYGTKACLRFPSPYHEEDER
ncbi:sensor histidine kinase [Desulfosporosinus fructosivorans]|uniref:histidine kinase n=1 Tax=Desulfosporosinus fructosivorans TaxID=2018669 RepID=A0A4Z0QXJ8_9FIRM|nr:sensor histidine kinase [Desulfosporosinus fructosivorans]TGE35049.1 sensor histidine kinase [Desulfosporosinus fructosivorans]